MLIGIRRLLAVGCLGVVACREADHPTPEGTSTAPNPQNELQERLRPNYHVQQPPGSPVAPLILFVSGCSGFSEPSLYARRAAKLVQEGYVVAYVDYLGAHGMKSACKPDYAKRTWTDEHGPRDGGGQFITLDQIGEYVLAAASELRTRPYVRADRVFAIGWSLGGGGVLAALRMIRPENSPLRAVVALYPACRGVPGWRESVPALIVLAALDNIQPPQFCQEFVAGLHASTPITIQTLPRAHHAFDADELPVVTHPATGPTVGYNPDAGARAWETIRKFLK